MSRKKTVFKTMYEWMEDFMGEDGAEFFAPLLGFFAAMVGGGFALWTLISLVLLPFSIAKAHARASVYEKVTGHEVTAWEVFWTGEIPSFELQVKQKGESE